MSYVTIYKGGRRIGLAVDVEFSMAVDHEPARDGAAHAETHRISGSARQLRTTTQDTDDLDFEGACDPASQESVTLHGVSLLGPILRLSKGVTGDGMTRVRFVARTAFGPRDRTPVVHRVVSEVGR